MTKLEQLKAERQNILNQRPELAFCGDFSPEGCRLFEIEQEIEKLKECQ